MTEQAPNIRDADGLLAVHGVGVLQPFLVEHLPGTQESINSDGLSDKQPCKRHAKTVQIGDGRCRLKAKSGEGAIIQVTTSPGGGGGGLCRPPTPCAGVARGRGDQARDARQGQGQLHFDVDASLLAGHGVANLLIWCCWSGLMLRLSQACEAQRAERVPKRLGR